MQPNSIYYAEKRGFQLVLGAAQLPTATNRSALGMPLATLVRLRRLLQLGFIQRTPKGRMATETAQNHLNT